MNREEFTDVLSQNIQIVGGMTRVYSMLVYSGIIGESLVPQQLNKNLLTVPVGNGFRITLSKNEKRLADNASSNIFNKVRATRKTFSTILDSGKKLGFKLSDITLNKGVNEIVTVKNDPAIAADTYDKYSKDPQITPTFLGFTSGPSNVTFDIDMRIGCTEYVRESGYLIYEAVSAVLGDLKVYKDLQDAFQPKRSDEEIPTINAIDLECKFKDAGHIEAHLDTFFSGELQLYRTDSKTVEFSSSDGNWGEIVLTESGSRIFFKSKVDYSFGVRLMDTLNAEVR